MKLNPDITRLGWLIVAIVLAVSGILHMIGQEIYPHVRGVGAPQALEGWPVFAIGAGKIALGLVVLLLAYRWSWR